MMINSENSDVDLLRRRGLLTLESTSRTVVWVVENYHSVLTSEHSICSNTFRVPTLSNFLFHMSLSLSEDLFSLNVIRIVKNSLSFLQTNLNSVIKVNISLTDTLNQMQLSKDFMMTKDNVSSPINFDRKVRSERLINEANLEVRCTMTVTDFESFQTRQKKEIIRKFENNYVPSITTAELKDHLEVILDGDEDNCVTIFVQGDVFQVHRTVLCSNSSVFSAMFEYDTSEKISNEIHIEDISVDTVGDILSFMYFGSTSKLSLQKAIDVYTAADKYAILKLKKKCSDFLISNLSKDSVLDILSLADRHGDEELKESAIKFLVTGAVDIIESDEFLSFIENESELARRIILHTLKITSK